MKPRMWIVDPVSKRKSVTLTAFAIGYMVAILKLIFSGITIFKYQIPVFSGFEFSAAVTALGGIYVLRRTKSGQAFCPPQCQPPTQEQNG